MTVRHAQCSVVFALTSDGNDNYAAMTRLAARTVRLSNPDVRITVACDSRTSSIMTSASYPLVGEVDQWFPIETPEGSQGYRSRFVKTILPSQIERPFLFLDSDVFVRDRIEELFALDCDVAAAPNHSRDRHLEQIWIQDHETLERMGWIALPTVYLNSGVILYQDTTRALEFAKAWHRNWLGSVGHEAYYRDQPAFNAALYGAEPRLHVLPHRFNAQIAPSPEVAPEAAIWHYYSSTGQISLALFDPLIKEIMASGNIDAEKIRRLVDARHPWISDGLLDTWNQMASLRDDNSRLRDDNSRLRNDNSRLRNELDALWTDQQRILSSRSWRITGPLRMIDKALKGWFEKDDSHKQTKA